jgi:hypothetical protein
MATTVHEPPKHDLDRLPSQGSGNGGWRNLVPADGDLRRVKDYAPRPASTGIWVGLAAITMTFAAFTSALVVRQGAAPDWQHITLPSILYFGNLAPPRGRLYGRLKRSQREPCPLALYHSLVGSAFCCRPDFCLGATKIPGLRHRHQRQLLFLLCPDRCPRLASAWRPRWTGSRHWKVAQFGLTTKYPGRHFAILAFHGCPVGVPAFSALDEALTQLKGRRQSEPS